MPAADATAAPTIFVVDEAALAPVQAAMRVRFSERGAVLFVGSSHVDSAVLRLDRQRLGQVVTNLLDNARRHADPGCHEPCVEGSGLVVELDDDRDGLPREQLPLDVGARP